MPIYTRRGDDGTTGLLHGTRVGKGSPTIAALGDTDEAQAAIGVARAAAVGELRDLLTEVAASLWDVMGSIAGADDVRLDPAPLEAAIDRVVSNCPMPTDFVVPGENGLAASLDLARAVVRRAERSVIGAVGPGPAAVYLNRLADLLWVLARQQAGGSTIAKATTRRAE